MGLSTRANDTDWDCDDASFGDGYARSLRKPNRQRQALATKQQREVRPPVERAPRGPSRKARLGQEAFKCRHCRAFIGPTVSGGRHRNHCPLCLYSRHVDGQRPGDRASSCGALMAPIARFDRPNGEPVVVHRCLGCGLERHNRLAADDSIAVLVRLALVAARVGQRAAADDGKPAEGTRETKRRVS